MEGATLNAHGRADPLTRVSEPTTPISEDQLRGRDPTNEHTPSPGVLAPSRVLAQHMIGR